MRITVIVNPNAGRQQIMKDMDLVREIFAASGAQVDIIETESPEDAQNAVRAILAAARDQQSKADCLVCCGGDGTLSETVGWVLKEHARIPLGYIPAGTTNDFAASLNLPKEPTAAAQHILSRRAAPLDVGLFDGRTFIYTASFGAFTGSSYNTDPALKHAFGHLAYVLEGLLELPTIQPYHVQVTTAEGLTFEDDYIFGSLTNATSLGGVVKLDPALVDFRDGQFELMLVKAPKTLAEFNAMVHSLISGKYDEEIITFVHTAGVKFTFEKPVDWSLDGEYAAGDVTVETKVLPHAIRLHY